MSKSKTKESRSAQKETAPNAQPLIDLDVLDPLDRCLFMHCVEAAPLKELDVWFKLITKRRILTEGPRAQGSLDDSSRSNMSEVAQTDQRTEKASSVRPAVKQSYGT